MSDDDELRQLARDLFAAPDADDTDDEPRRRNHVPREGLHSPGMGWTPEMETTDFVRELFNPNHIPARPPQLPEIHYRTEHH